MLREIEALATLGPTLGPYAELRLLRKKEEPRQPAAALFNKQFSHGGNVAHDEKTSLETILGTRTCLSICGTFGRVTRGRARSRGKVNPGIASAMPVTDAYFLRATRFYICLCVLKKRR